MVQQCSDATLASLAPSVGSLSPSFSSGTTYYTLLVFSFVTSVSLSAVVNQADATISWSPAGGVVTGLVYGSSQTIRCTITAQDSSQQTYLVVVSRAPSNNPLIASITSSESLAQLAPSFVPILTSYTIWVPASVSSVPLSATPQTNGASASCNSGTLSGSPQTFTCTGTAQDGSTQQIYTIVVTRGLNSNSYLASLSSSIGSLSPGFGQQTYTYTLTTSVSASTSQMSVQASAVESTSTVKLAVNQAPEVAMQANTDYQVSLQVGDTLLSIQVVAQDGTFNTYTIAVHRLSNDATLAALTTSASQAISPTFLSGTTSYTVSVPASLSTINIEPTFSYALATFTLVVNGNTIQWSVSASQSLDACSLNTGDNPIQLQVTSEDGSAQITYTITVHRYSSNSLLGAIAFGNSVSITSSFASTTYVYTMNTLSYSTSWTTVSVTPVYGLSGCAYTFNGVTTAYVPLSNGATSSSFGLPVGDLVLNVNCQSEDGLSSSLYTFAFHRRSADSSLQTLTSSTGTLLPSFSTGTTSGYTTTTNAPSVSFQAVPTSSCATFTYQWNSGGAISPSGNTITNLVPNTGDNSLTITVTSEDASSTTTYSLTVHKQSTNSLLNGLSVSVGTILPIFASSVNTYSLKVANSVSSTTITASVQSLYSTIGYSVLVTAPTSSVLTAAKYAAFPASSVTPSLALNTGYNYVAVSVNAEDPTQPTNYYTISIYRPTVGSAFYSLTTVHGSATNDYLPNPFVATTFAYAITMPYADSTLAVSTVLSFPLSTTTYSYQSSSLVSYTNTVPTLSVPIGDSSLVLVCTAEDASSTSQYTISIHRKSNDASLAFFGLASGSVTPTLSPLFASGVTTSAIYATTVAQTVSTIVLTAVATNSEATVMYSYNISPASESSGQWNSFTEDASLSLVLGEGDNWAFVCVVAEDTVATPSPVYTRVNIHRMSSTSTLHAMSTSITSPSTLAAAAAFTPAFTPSVYQYRMTLQSGATGLGAVLVPDSSFGTLTYTIGGSTAASVPASNTLTDLPLVSGDQNLNIIVLSEDGLTTNTYTILVHRISTIVDLVSAVPSIGVTTPVVSLTEASNSYTMTISPTSSTLAFTPTLESLVSSLYYRSYQSSSSSVPNYLGLVSGVSTGPMKMFVGDTIVELQVIAEDISYSRVYQFIIHRISSNVLLDSITISGVVSQTWTPAFSPTTGVYEILTDAASPQFTFQVAQQWPLANTVFTLAGTSTSAVTSLADQTSSSTQQLLISDDAPNGVNVLNLTVTAEDGITVVVYTLSIRRLSNNAQIVQFAPNPSSITLDADDITNGFTTTVPNSQLAFATTPTLASIYVQQLIYVIHYGYQDIHEDPATRIAAASTVSTLAWGQSTIWAALIAGNNFFLFRVTAEDGTQAFYQIKVHRISVEWRLSDISVVPVGTGLSPAFTPDVLLYNMTLPTADDAFTINVAYYYPLMTSVNLVFTDESGNTRAPIALGNSVTSDSITLPIGIATLIITLVAEDGIATGSYTVRINRISNDCLLSNLVANPTSYGFIPLFQPNYGNYILSLAPTISSVVLTPTFSWPRATAVFNIFSSDRSLVSSTPIANNAATAPVTLIVGNTSTTFVVTAEDGLTVNTYAININRISTDSRIATIDFNGYDESNTLIDDITDLVTPTFDLNTVGYTIMLSNAFYGAAFSAIQNYPRAYLTWTLGALSTPTSEPADLPRNTLTDVLTIAPGPNTFTFICWAQDTVTSTNYVFNITRQGDLVALAFLSQPTDFWLTAQPTFVQGLAEASLQVAYLSEAIGIRATYFTVGSTTAWHQTYPTDLQTLVNDTLTGSFPLDVGTNIINVHNSKDPWLYSLTVVRAVPDITGITLVVSPGPVLDYIPGDVFVSAIRYYTADVPYITDTVDVTTFYNTPSSTVTVQITNSLVDAQFLTSGAQLTLSLTEGINLITVVSTLDGTYVWNVTRLAPDVCELVITTQRADWTIATNINISPNFTGGTMAYTTALPSVMRNISFLFTYEFVPQATVSTSWFGRINEPVDDLGTWNGIAELLVSGSPSSFYSMELGINYFGIYSSRDGWYVFSVYRGDADVGGIVLTGLNWDLSTVTLAQLPPFIPNKLGSRHVQVRKTTLTYMVTVLYGTPGATSLLVDVDDPARAVTIPSNSMLSQQQVGPFTLNTLMNTLNVLSVIDGGYLYNLYQELGDVKNISIVPTTHDGLRSIAPTTPLFESGIVGMDQVYDLTVPFRLGRFQFRVELITARSAFVIHFLVPNFICTTDNTANSSFLVNNTDLPVAGLETPLIIGTQLFAVYSLLDGFYYHHIERLVPDILAVNVTLNPGHSLDSAGANNWFSVSPSPNQFSSYINYYEGEVNFITEVIRLTMTVKTPDAYSILFQDSLGDITSKTMPGVDGSFDFNPQVGVNWLNLTADLDGIYIFRLTRRPPDVQVVPFSPQVNGFDRFGQPVLNRTSGEIQNSPMIPPLYTPVFDRFVTATSYIAPIQTSYDLSVSYTVTFLALDVVFLNADDKNIVTLVNTSYTSTNGDGAVVTGNLIGFQTLTTSVVSDRYTLPSEGVYTLVLNSLLDGEYHFTITRLPPDLISLQLLGWTQAEAQTVILPTEPAYESHHFNYTLSVPYIVSMVDFQCRHVRSDATFRAINLDTGVIVVSGIVGASIPSSTDLLDTIRFLPLTAGITNRFMLDSSLDGQYFISIYRALPALRGIQIQAELMNQNVAFSSEAVQLPAAMTTIYTASNLVPLFTRGNYAYTFSVPFTVSRLRFEIDWSLDVLAEQEANLQLVSNLYAPSGSAFNVDTGVGTLQANLPNDTYSAYFPLSCAPATNTVRFISTVDGNYTITITRLRADITSIVVEGDSTTNSLLPVDWSNLALQPAFARPAATTDMMIFTINVPWLWSAIHVRAVFAQYSTVTLYDTKNITYNLISGSDSASVMINTPDSTGLLQTFSRYMLLTLQDGLYRLDITRAAPDLRDVVVYPSFVTCDASSSYLLDTPIKWNQVPGPVQTATGLFIPAEYLYTASVPYAVTGLAMSAVCGTTWAAPNMSVWMQNGDSSMAEYIPYACNTTIGASDSILPLALGNNTLWLRSDADGVFQFRVRRLSPTLTSVVFTGWTDTTPSYSGLFTVSEPAIFTPGAFDYTAYLPEVANRVGINLTQSDNAVLSLVSNTNAVESIGYLADVSLSSSLWSMEVGTNQFVVQSTLDGCYTFNVSRRSFSFVTAVEIDLPQPYQSENDQAALAEFGARTFNGQIQADVTSSDYIVTSTGATLTAQMQDAYQVFCGCTGEDNGTEIEYASGCLGTPRIFTFSPPFMGGWVGPYTATVRHDTEYFEFAAQLLPTSSEFNCTINGAPFSLVNETSTSLTAEVPLDRIGDNLILCDSNDGEYVFHVTRGNGIWSLPAVPFHLYANEQTSQMRLAPVGLVPTELNLELVWTQGSIAPAFFPVASPLLLLLTDAAYFTYTAPNVVVETTTYLSFVSAGVSSWAFDLAPIWNVTVLPQQVMTWSGINNERIYYSTQLCPLITLTPSEATNAGGVTVVVEIVDLATNEAWTMATLVFPPFSIEPIAFRMLMPTVTTNRTVSLRAAISGDDRAHFKTPESVTLGLNVRGAFVFTGLSSSLFVSQATEVTVAPSQPPHSELTMNIIISEGAALFEDQGTKYGYIYNESDVSQRQLTLVFPPFSLEPQRFVVQVLPSLASSLSVITQFSFTGVDASHFSSIANHTLTVLPASQMLLQSVPTQLTNRDVSSPVTLQLVDAPPTNVTVHIIVTGGGETTVDAIDYAAGGSLTNTFIYNAPYWYTGVSGDNGFVTVTLNFTLSGLDAGMYLPPTSLTVQIVQAVADVRSVEFFAEGADHVSINLEASMDPFVGNILSYFTQLHVAVMETDAVNSVGSRRRLLSSTASDASGKGSNVTLAVRAMFVTSGTVFATLNTELNGTWTNQTQSLTSGVISSYTALAGGINYFHVYSNLDGPYVFEFNASTVANTAPCVSKADSQGLMSYGLPIQSFVDSDVNDLVAATGDASLANSNQTQLLLCATIGAVVEVSSELLQAALNAPAVSVSLASTPQSSWIFLALLAAYFALAVSAGVAVGRRQLLKEQVSGEFTSIALSAPSDAAEENMVQRAGRFGRAVVQRSRTLILATAAFSLPHLLLILCTLRAVDMMLYHSFIHSFSLAIFRLLVGLPHILLPWVMLAVYQQARILLRLDSTETDKELPGAHTAIDLVDEGEHEHDELAEMPPEMEEHEPSRRSLEGGVEGESVRDLSQASQLDQVDRESSLVWEEQQQEGDLAHVEGQAGAVALDEPIAADDDGDQREVPAGSPVSRYVIGGGFLQRIGNHPKFRDWSARLASPHHWCGLSLNGGLTLLFIVIYAVIASVLAKPVYRSIDIERGIISLVISFVLFYTFMVLARTHDEVRRSKRLGLASMLDQDEKSVRKREVARRIMLLICFTSCVGCLLLFILYDYSNITRTDFQRWVVPFSIIECVCVAAILWLLHGAIRMQRFGMLRLRSKWRSENLLAGMRFGPYGFRLDDEEYEEDEDEEDESEEEEEEGGADGMSPFDVDALDTPAGARDALPEIPSAVDRLLDSSPFISASSPSHAPHSWTVQTEKRTHGWVLNQDIDIDERPQEWALHRKEFNLKRQQKQQQQQQQQRLHGWLLYADIFADESGVPIRGRDVDLSPAQLQTLIDLGHVGESVTEAIREIQSSGLKFRGVPDLLAHLERRKADITSRELAHIAAEVRTILQFVNEESTLLKRLPKHDGTPNGQSIMSTEEAVSGLQHFINSELAGVEHIDNDAKVAARTRAIDSMLRACQVLAECACRFATPAALLLALQQPSTPPSQIQAMRTANLRREEAQTIANYVNDDTSLLRPRRGHAVLQVTEAETILNLVEEQTYSPDEYEYPVATAASSSSTPVSPSWAVRRALSRSAASVSFTPRKWQVPLRKNNLLEPLPPEQIHHPNAQVEGEPQQRHDAGDESLESVASLSPISGSVRSRLRVTDLDSIEEPSQTNDFDEDASDEESAAHASSLHVPSTLPPLMPLGSHAIPQVEQQSALKKSLPPTRRAIIDDIIQRLASWQQMRMRFESTPKLIDAFRSQAVSPALSATPPQEVAPLDQVAEPESWTPVPEQDAMPQPEPLTQSNDEKAKEAQLQLEQEEATREAERLAREAESRALAVAAEAQLEVERRQAEADRLAAEASRERRLAQIEAANRAAARAEQDRLAAQMALLQEKSRRESELRAAAEEEGRLFREHQEEMHRIQNEAIVERERQRAEQIIADIDSALNARAAAEAAIQAESAAEAALDAEMARLTAEAEAEAAAAAAATPTDGSKSERDVDSDQPQDEVEEESLPEPNVLQKEDVRRDLTRHASLLTPSHRRATTDDLPPSRLNRSHSTMLPSRRLASGTHASLTGPGRVMGFGSGTSRAEHLTADELRSKRTSEVQERKRQRERNSATFRSAGDSISIAVSSPPFGARSSPRNGPVGAGRGRVAGVAGDISATTATGMWTRLRGDAGADPESDLQVPRSPSSSGVSGSLFFLDDLADASSSSAWRSHTPASPSRIVAPPRTRVDPTVLVSSSEVDEEADAEPVAVSSQRPLSIRPRVGDTTHVELPGATRP